MADATVLYDSDCGFCKWMLSGFLRWDRHARLAPCALQRPEAEALLGDMPAELRMASWHLVADGRRRSGGEAIAPLMRMLPGGAVPATLVELIPDVTDRSYRWVATHRSQISRWVPSAAKRRASDVVLRIEQERGPGPAPACAPGSAGAPPL